MSKCLIKLENNHLGFYYSGQVVSGVVEVNLKKALSCKGLRLSMTGKADFKWKSENKESFREKEIYLENLVYIFGNDDADAVEIEAGFHSFSFSSALPLNIPSSFECQEGKISYKVEAYFVLPWKINYLKAKTYLKVVSYVDLNIDAVLKLPFYTEISKNVQNFFFGSKALHMKVCTPFSGFIPGHKVKLIFDINNKTAINVRKTVIHLVQITKLTSGEHSKTDRTVILEVSALGTNKKSSNQFENDITIPMNLVPVKHSNIVNISYEIEIVAKMSSSAKKNPKFLIPIEIGTVPINFERSNRCFGNLNLEVTRSFRRMQSCPTAPLSRSAFALSNENPMYFDQLSFDFEDKALLDYSDTQN